MPTYPDDVTLVRIRHTPVTTGGRILAGNLVSAVVSERVWGEEGSILPAEHSTTIQADGSWEIELPAVDSPGLRPQGVAYRITEHVPGGRALWAAPLVSHAPGPVDLADVLTPAPSPGGGIIIQTGPATDASMAEIADDPDSQFHASLSGTYVTLGDLPSHVAQSIAGLVQRGPWDTDTTYSPGEIVSHGGYLWFAASTAPTVRTQYIPNPRFAVDADGWLILRDATVSVQDATLTYTSTESITAARALFYSGEGEGWAAATQGGEVWSTAVTLGLPAGAPESVSVRVGVLFGPSLPVDVPSQTNVTLTPGEQVRVECLAATAPEGRTTAGLAVVANQSLPGGVTLTVSEPILERATTVGPYFDGDTDDTGAATHGWTGTPHASPSTETRQEITHEPGTSEQWVALGQAAPNSSGGVGVTVSDTAPASGLWVNTSKEA